MAYIYQITNDINQKIYIGKTEFSIEKRFKEHCKDRVKQRHISYDEILDTLQHGKLIEVHFLGNRCTVLLRKQRHNKAEDLIVVFNPVIGQVVSVYINASNDNHDTLREELYNKDLDVQKRLEQCIKNSR